MPSPFPGMDPFLEDPLHFPGLHDRMITGISDALQPRLPPAYYAEIGERLWIEVAERTLQPDVHIVHQGLPANSQGATSVAASQHVRTNPIVITVPLDERREIYVDIRRRGTESDRVVTSLELLSMSNKTPGEQGRDLYLRKQQQILHSETHLVEVDLLRGGTHSTAVPLDWLAARAGPYDYHVSVHRFDRPLDYFVYPNRLMEPLPEIIIPLLPQDGDITLDLQEVFQQCYDRGPYRRKVRYELNQLRPILRPQQHAWAEERLEAAASDVNR